jgi:nicotinate-nucleotide pyrophosphorylase (carboxylating)
VEARDLNEVKEIVACEGVYRILLDNFDEMTRKAVLFWGSKLNGILGNINEETIRAYAECGELHIFRCINILYNMDLSLKRYKLAFYAT